MAWRRPGDKPLSKLMMVSLLTHICVTRPQWVNTMHCTNHVWPIQISHNDTRIFLSLHREFITPARRQGSRQTISVEGLKPSPCEFPRALCKFWSFPPLKYLTNHPFFVGPLGPRVKFHKGPSGFSWAQALSYRTQEHLESLIYDKCCMTGYCYVFSYIL